MLFTKLESFEFVVPKRGIIAREPALSEVEGNLLFFATLASFLSDLRVKLWAAT
jgi:hypothetical protein